MLFESIGSVTTPVTRPATFAVVVEAPLKTCPLLIGDGPLANHWVGVELADPPWTSLAATAVAPLAEVGRAKALPIKFPATSIGTAAPARLPPKVMRKVLPVMAASTVAVPRPPPGLLGSASKMFKAFWMLEAGSVPPDAMRLGDSATVAPGKPVKPSVYDPVVPVTARICSAIGLATRSGRLFAPRKVPPKMMV
jgi:hypothetical protein